MNIKFIEYDGIKGYSRVMYNDVKDADKYNIEVAYNGKDIKALLEYLFEQEEKIEKAIEYIKSCEWSNGIDNEMQYSLHIPTLLKILGGNNETI